MFRAIREEILKIKGSKKDIRNFGLVVGTALCVLGIYDAWQGKDWFVYLVFIGFGFVIAGFFGEMILRPLYKVWMIIAIILGNIITRIILVIAFYLLITPIGLLARLTGKEFLARSLESDKSSYWEKRSAKDAGNLEKQF